MKYNELITQDTDFNYSINLQLDIRNESKISQYIPSNVMVNLLKEYFRDVTRNKSKNHSKLLYGSYGTGKSHFMTTVSALLGKYYQSSAYENLLNRISIYDEVFSEEIRTFVKTSKPYLIVPVVSDYLEFQKTLYFSLKKVLNEKNIELTISDFYTKAINVMDTWMKNEELKCKVNEICLEYKKNFDQLYNGIKEFDDNFVELFKIVFKKLTFGITFVYEISNIVGVLDTINQSVLEHGYRGIIFVFDEFGRYIEDNIKKIKIKDVQDMAEYCDHSNYDNHLILISHKEISQYSTKYEKDISEEWRKVEGRFKQYSIDNKENHNLSLVRYVIPKKIPIWSKFKEDKKHELEELLRKVKEYSLHSFAEEELEEMLEWGYPLHPMALYMLDRLSQKVAQNERTFFTFLAGKDKGSLYDFLENTDLTKFHFMGADWIFNYFESNIKSLRGTIEYEHWLRYRNAINKCNVNDIDYYNSCIQILKTLTLIEIIDDYNILKPTELVFKSVIDKPTDVIEDSLKFLVDEKIIKYHRAYKHYCFYQASSLDIDKEVEKLISISSGIEPTIDILNKEFAVIPTQPYRYNDEFKMKRYFTPEFIWISEIDEYTKKFDSSYKDGAIVLIVSDKIIETSKVINELRGSRIIYILNEHIADILPEVRKYIALKYIESNKIEKLLEEDPAILLEVQQYKEELRKFIKNELSKSIYVDKENTSVIYEGRNLDNVQSLENLSIVMSDVFYNNYPYTLIVNNEMVNKNNLSHAMVTSRKELLDKLLNEEDSSNYFGLQVLSPTYTFLRSVLLKNHLYNGDSITLVEQQEVTENITMICNEIYNFIDRARQTSIKFNEIYDILKKPPYGLRDGYISVLWAALLRRYRKDFIIKNGTIEQEISGELFEKILKQPKDYTIFINQWEEEKANYISKLENLFRLNIIESLKRRNRLKALYEGMLTHYKLISKFSRTSNEYTSDSVKIYRRLIEKEVLDYTVFFFEELGEIGKSYEDTIMIIQQVKEEMEKLTIKMSDILQEDLIKIFGSGSNNDLLSLLSLEYSKKWMHKEQKVFDYTTNNFIKMVKELNKFKNGVELINELAKVITGFELNYWSDKHREYFIKEIKNIKNSLDDYIPSNHLKDSEIKISIEDKTGNIKPIILEQKTIEDNGKLLKHILKSNIDGFGHSLSYEEKIQVILELLNDFTKQ